MRALVTTVARNYLPQARLLMASAGRFQPDVHRYVLVVDAVGADVFDLPGCTILTAADVLPDTDERLRRQFIYDIFEYPCSLKALLLQKLLRAHEWVTFLDPDMLLLAPLPAEVLAPVGAAPRLTPHRLTPAPLDGLFPDDVFVHQYGLFNLGFITVGRDCSAFLAWWESRLRRGALARVAAAQYTDQRVLDLAVTHFGVDVVRHPGLNVGKWNLDERPLAAGPPIRAGDADLVLPHFSGVPGPDGSPPPAQLQTSRARARRDQQSLHVFTRLCAEYAADVAATRQQIGAPEYRWGRYPDGSRISLVARRRYRRHLLAAELAGREAPPVPSSEGAALGRLDFAVRSGVVEGLSEGLNLDRERWRRIGSRGVLGRLR